MSDIQDADFSPKPRIGFEVDTIKLIQVFDTQDSVKFRGKEVTASVVMKKSTDAFIDNIFLRVVTGTGTNETMTDLLGSGWTGEDYHDSSDFAGSITTTYDLYSLTTTLDDDINQLRVEFYAVFSAFVTPTDDRIIIQGIYLVEGATAREMDTKSMAVVQQECCRYKRVVDEVYFSDVPSTHFIDMRDEPTVALSPAPGFGYTVSSTSQHALILNLTSSADNAIYELTLDAELL
jgi:hypothetical protein